MGFFKELFTKKKRYERLDIDSTVCGFHVSAYNDKTGNIVYGECEIYRMINISMGGIAVRHENILKKGDIIEFHTKYCIKDSDCFSCPHFSEVEEKLTIAPFIGKVIWRNDFLAGFNIVSLKEKDRTYLEKLVRSGEY